MSVSICTFQGEQYLEAQLASVLEQTRRPDEVVVSDDGSTDATLDIVEAFAMTAPFPVRVLTSDRRLGVSRNFERAIEGASGDVIVLSDQDDRWVPTRLARLEAAFASEPSIAFAFSDSWLIDRRGRRTGERFWSVAGFGASHRVRMRRDPFGQLMGRSIVSGCTLAVRATWLPMLLPFPSEQTGTKTRVLHDRWISLCLSAAAGRAGVGVIEEPLVEYRLHPAQQVGIPNLQIRRLVPTEVLRWRSAAVPTGEHNARLHATIDLLDMIDKRIDRELGGAGDEQRRRVAAAADHLRARSELGTHRRGRVAGVARELAAGRYHQFSLGIASATADLVRS